MDHLDAETARRLLRSELTQAEGAAWDRHIRHCRVCRERLAQERVWASLMELGDPAAGAPPIAVDQLLERIEQLVPGARLRRLRRQAAMLSTAAASVGLTLLLWWQLGTWSRATNAAAGGELRIPMERQFRAAAHLDVLQTLERDGWLTDEYDAVQTLSQLIDEDQP